MTQEDLQLAINEIAFKSDQSSFEKIYTCYYNRLFRLALSIVKSEEIAEEIYDDVMLIIWEKRQQLILINNLTVYLYVSVKNASLRHLSRDNKLSQVNIDEIDIEICDIAPTAQDQMISIEFLKEINMVIEKLSPQCKIVFKLVKEDGLKYREAAEILNISVKNVEYHIGNALKKIGQHLAHLKKPFIQEAFKSIISN
ncbi:MAG: polymerase sigma-70 factor [Chthonomonadaceae bacterium]|nr:polymerase sigma-70 factor [Chthonomonadaceae bacterium]